MGDTLAAIEASLALAAERLGDPAGLVYARLFALHPAMEAEFWRDRSGAIKGEMLARAFEALLDMAGPRHYADHFIAGELITHDNYGIPRAVFADFYPVIRDVVAAACAADFTPAMAEAWAVLLADIAAVMARQPGYSDAARAIDVDDVLGGVARGVFYPSGACLGLDQG
jgi:hypothetical protein